jgi:hypothetical protein
VDQSFGPAEKPENFPETRLQIKEFAMKKSLRYLTTLCGAMLVTAGSSSLVLADTLFFDDFEGSVKDQAEITIEGEGALGGPGWTWYNQTYSDAACTVYVSGFGPFDDGNSSDYLQENRNYWTASADVGQGDSYFRAGLEVPAWATDDGEKVVLSNMLRIYGDQYYNPDVTSCKRTLVFQEMTAAEAGSFTFSFDVAMDRFGAPAFGETTAAFVKVIKISDVSYNEMLFQDAETNPPVSSTPENASTSSQGIDFTITEEMVGELLQFGFYTDITVDEGQGWGTSAALYDNVMLSTLDIGPAHTGSYFNADQSGHGFSIEFGELGGSPLAVVYWYTYDNLGNPIFMVGSGVPDGQEVVITFDSPVGMKYGEFDPDSVTREVGGVAIFNFSDRNNATFSYTPSDFSTANWGHTTAIEALPLTKLFDIPADKYFSTTE